MRPLIPLLLLGLAAPALAQGPGTPSVEGRITRLDPRFDALVPPGAALERVTGGHEWVEGPLWDRRTGCLLFSDIPRNAIYRWCEGQGEQLFLTQSGYTGAAPFTGAEPGSNGLAFAPDGALLLAEHGDRRISRLEADGRKTTLADRFAGRRINSPNDVIVAANGDLLFTDPPWGLPKWWDDPGKELPWSGVYRRTVDGDVRLLSREFEAPNGIALSADEQTLVVSESRPELGGWYAMAVLPDGTVGPRRLLLDGRPWAAGRKGVPDGLKLDAGGTIFGGGPGGVYVIHPDGTLLGIIETGSATSNTAWAGDGSLLYITAGTQVFRIRTTTRGAGW